MYTTDMKFFPLLFTVLAVSAFYHYFIKPESGEYWMPTNNESFYSVLESDVKKWESLVQQLEQPHVYTKNVSINTFKKMCEDSMHVTTFVLLTTNADSSLHMEFKLFLKNTLYQSELHIPAPSASG